MQEYSTNKEFSYNQDLIAAKQCIKKYSTNYAFSTKLLDESTQNDTVIAYAFFRFLDEIVDNPAIGSDIFTELNNVRQIWDQMKIGYYNDSDQPNFVRGMFDLCVRRNIPLEYVDSFMDAMIIDTVKIRYRTYSELEEYMYGSATVVGYIMMYVFGYNSPDAFNYARYYGEAMQLINFTRDINEDLIGRGRIYIPQEYMDKYGVTEEMLYAGVMNSQIKELVMFLSSKSRDLLQQGRKGIPLLNRRVWLPVFVAGNIYEYNLNILEKRNYDIFRKPIRIPKYRKIIIIFMSILNLHTLARFNKN
jgi:phytoene synthase